MKNQKTQQTALNRAKAKIEFRIHLINYLIINTLLAIINLTLQINFTIMHIHLLRK